MKRMKLGKHRITMYDSIEELPMVRFQKYNKCLMIDAGLGSDLRAIDMHLTRTSEYIRKGELENAATEMDNLRITLYNVQNGLTPHFLALTALITNADGEDTTDVSDDALMALYERLSDATVKDADDTLSSVKKKLERELNAYFPERQETASVKEFYDIIKERSLLVLENVVSGESEERDELMKELTSTLLTKEKPQKYTGKSNVEIAYDKSFIGSCIAIQQNLGIDAKNMTVIEYYRAIEYLEKQSEKGMNARSARRF